jgi:cell wall assembly regulator SMI1
VTIDEFIAAMTDRGKPAAPQAIEAFEREIGQALPEDYRRFLAECNGGYAAGRLAFGSGPDCVAVNHVAGLQRREYAFSLPQRRRILQGPEPRIPRSLIPIMDDPLGNAVCLGVAGAEHGRVHFWDHEDKPDPDEWDGEMETAGNLRLLAESFTEFVAGLREFDDEQP